MGGNLPLKLRGVAIIRGFVWRNQRLVSNSYDTGWTGIPWWSPNTSEKTMTDEIAIRANHRLVNIEGINDAERLHCPSAGC